MANSNFIEAKNTIFDADYGIQTLNRSSFPKGFLFGSATSAYQVEGAACEDGRGPSIWDTYTHKFPQNIKGEKKNGDVADDSYHRYKEDVQLMKEMGIRCLQILDLMVEDITFDRDVPMEPLREPQGNPRGPRKRPKVKDKEQSVSSQLSVLPGSTFSHKAGFVTLITGVLEDGKVSKGINEKGVAYYKNLIDELEANEIQPFVTLFHWDVPQSLQDEYGGFYSPEIVDDFRDYADLCFDKFGEKVRHWMTINEPWTFGSVRDIAQVAICSTDQCDKSEPDNCSNFDKATHPYLIGHHMLLAHAAAVDVYRRKHQASQSGIIGLALNSMWLVPKTQEGHDHDATRRALDFMFGWFMDPVTNGAYPQTMRSLVGKRLPEFSDEQSLLLKGSYDFLGLNYYTGHYAEHAPEFMDEKPSYKFDSIARLTPERHDGPIGEKAASDWLYVYPRGIYDLLLHIKEKYNDPIIYITENGVDEADDPDKTPEEASADGKRIEYYYDHLTFIQQAIGKEVRLRGYFAWSLLDNFEWDSGYTLRFGTHYVDYKDGLKRYPKHSAKWFKNFLQK